MNIQEEKIKNVILFFANKSEGKSIEKLKLIKLIWLSDRLHLNKYGRLILNDKYKALPYSPVASKVLDMSSNAYHSTVYKIEGYFIKAIAEVNYDFFSKSDIEIMEYVWEKFGKENSFSLRDYSHEFPEWKRFESLLKEKGAPNAYDMIIQDFFTTPEGENFSDLFSKEEQEISEHDFNVHSAIQSVLN